METRHELRRTLSLADGVALAMGSIAGSGILFLPSLTYAVAGHGVLLAWLGGTLLCIPMLFMFSAMVRLVPDGSGIEGFVERGLGPRVASTVPILFLALVVCGLPGANLVAGSYVAQATGGGVPVQVAAALVLLGIALTANLGGRALGARVQKGVTWFLIAVSVGICAAAFPAAHTQYGAVAPGVTAAGPLLSAVVLAFWAFAGFENLTFIAGEFRNPTRDFPAAMVISFCLYGLLAVALTATVAALVPRDQVSAAGLLQLGHHLHPVWLASGVIVILAIALMQLNSVSWTWGMSRLVFRSAEVGRLPRWFATLNGRDLPARAIAVLGAVWVGGIVLEGAVPGFFLGGITIASGVFLFLYALCVASYLRIETGRGTRALYALFLLFLLGVLASVGVKALYPAIVFLAALAVSTLKGRRGARIEQAT